MKSGNMRMLIIMLSCAILNEQQCRCSLVYQLVNYRKISKISPSMYKPPKLVTQKTLRQIAPPNISPPGGLYSEIVLKYKVKQRKNGKFPSIYRASPIDFETQISPRRQAPPNIRPSKNKPLKKGLIRI